LVRRAQSSALGVLLTAPPETGERFGTWYVLPIDPETGELGDAVALVRRDFDRVSLDHCSATQDGWLVDTTLSSYPSMDLVNGSAPLDPAVEFRMLLDPGSACVRAMATRIEGAFVKSSGPVTKDPAVKNEEAIPFAATEHGSGKRWNFRCRRKRAFGL